MNAVGPDGTGGSGTNSNLKIGIRVYLVDDIGSKSDLSPAATGIDHLTNTCCRLLGPPASRREPEILAKVADHEFDRGVAPVTRELENGIAACRMSRVRKELDVHISGLIQSVCTLVSAVLPSRSIYGSDRATAGCVDVLSDGTDAAVLIVRWRRPGEVRTSYEYGIPWFA